MQEGPLPATKTERSRRPSDEAIPSSDEATANEIMPIDAGSIDVDVDADVTAAVPVTDAAVTPAPRPRVEQAKRSTVRLRTIPSGVLVRLGVQGKVLGRTPYVLTRNTNQFPLTVWLSRPNFHRKRIIIRGRKKSLMIRMKRKPTTSSKDPFEEM